MEAVLANEDVLEPGDYQAHIRIAGTAGIEFDRSTTVRVPSAGAAQDGPLSIPVLREEVRLETSGTHELTATLVRGGAPLGRSWEFYLSESPSPLGENAKVAVSGIDPRIQAWLIKRGIVCEPFSNSEVNRREIILVGDLPNRSADAQSWRALARKWLGEVLLHSFRMRRSSAATNRRVGFRSEIKDESMLFETGSITKSVSASRTTYSRGCQPKESWTGITTAR